MQKGSILALALLSVAACAPKPTVEWTEGETDGASGLAEYTIVVSNPPKDADWNIWCSQFRIRPRVLEGSEGAIEHVVGSLHRIYPTAEYGDTFTLRYLASPLSRTSWAPEVFTLDVKGRKPVQLEVKYNFQPLEEVADFEYTPVQLGITDMIPALKHVEFAEGSTVVDKNAVEYMIAELPDGNPGWYRISINGSVKVEAVTEDGFWNAEVTIDNLVRNAGSNELPNMTIEDWPDMQYRGVMLDVARNFTDKEGVKKLIDVLSHYKVNVLHLHLADDESWRLEIEDLPELTTFSAFHALPVFNEDGTFTEEKALLPSYSGAFTPEMKSTSNGYFSKKDFIEILRYAAAHHISVIPEMDSPGHARAAIKAMEKYAERTGDTSYLLSEEGDTSKYYSVQYYDDNALNVALPSSYKFMEKFFDTIIEYYDEAGVALPAVHVGGDEVAGGAWLGSPACIRLMEENGWTSTSELKDYFINRIMDIAEARGVKIAGWQEVALKMSDKTIDRMRGTLAFTNCWSTHRSRRTDELPYIFANQGLNVILSNMTNAYADFAYNSGRNEKGHSWGGYVDERRSFSLNPYNIYKSVRWDDNGQIVDIKDLSEDKTPLDPQAKRHILGVQAQLWSETIRGTDDVMYFLFPKMLGLFERGWNATPSWTETTVADDPLFTDDFNRFYSIVETREYPYYDALGICYRRHRQ